jgi:hypothetical protein
VRDAHRFRRAGFPPLYEFASSAGELCARCAAALRWLIESRFDPSPLSALVKTSIALESLLVIGREPPTRALGERAAYLLADAPDGRQAVSKAMSRFYEVRGSIVHGQRVGPGAEDALEFADRIVVLLLLVVAAQSPKWMTANDVQAYTDRLRWGHQPSWRRPCSNAHLRAALARLQ